MPQQTKPYISRRTNNRVTTGTARSGEWVGKADRDHVRARPCPFERERLPSVQTTDIFHLQVAAIASGLTELTSASLTRLQNVTD